MSERGMAIMLAPAGERSHDQRVCDITTHRPLLKVLLCWNRPETEAHTGPDTRPPSGLPAQASHQKPPVAGVAQQGPAWQHQPPQQGPAWQQPPQAQTSPYQPASSGGGSGLLGALVDLLAQLCSGGAKKR